MNEFIKKEDGFTAWRAKLNRLFERLSWLLKGTDEKCVLTSENGQVDWKPVQKEGQKEKEQDSRLKALSLNVAGIASLESLAVSGAAKFLCRIDADAGIAASAVSVNDAFVLKNSGGKEAHIWIAKDGLHLGNIVVGDREATLPPLVKIGGASIGCANGILKFYGKASPLSLDLNSGAADFPHGLWTEKVHFSGGSMDAERYTGTASAAERLASGAAVFGHAFDGTKDISGRIECCSGISLPASGDIAFGTGILQASEDVLQWSGTFVPKALYVNSEHYSEWYPSNSRLTEGDVISIDLGSDSETYVKVNERDKNPLAVVTSDWKMCAGVRTPNSYPCCSRGRAKAKVEGKVAAGTKLVVSSTAGALRPMNSKDKAYEAWAIALESSESEAVKLIKIHIL